MTEKPKPSNLIYLDYNSTTPVDDRVLECMMPWFSRSFGNAASSTHQAGRAASRAVELAREQVARSIGAEPSEIYFTSGATESINIALTGMAYAYRSKGNHIISWRTEHKAVLECLESLSAKGFRITLLNVDRQGRPDLHELKKNLSAETILVAKMAANNETGTISPLAEISSIVHDARSIFFTDATQAIGKIRFDVNDPMVDIASISSHKFYGPKGTGVLYIRRKNPRVTILPIMYGGGHEKGIRPGTLNVPGIIGTGKAIELAFDQQWDDATRLSKLRSQLEQRIESCGNVFINGDIRNRIPNTSNLTIQGVSNEQLITRIPSVAVASGSACTSELPEPSHVLKAMGLTKTECNNSIRISLGRHTTEQEITDAAEMILSAIETLRSKQVIH